MKQLIILLLTAITITTGCKKTEQSFKNPENKTTILNKSYEEQVKYAEANLKQLGTEIGKLTANQEFVNYIHESVAKKFDEEYEVLIKDIQNDYRWKESLNSATMTNALNAFKDLDGSNFYPQIYIPKFQAMEDDGLPVAIHASAAGSSQLTVPIVHVFYAGNAEVDSSSGEEIMPGYIIDANGDLVYWGMVDSAFANNNEVWVYSLNESVNNAGGSCPPQELNGVNFVNPDCETGGGDGGGGGGNTGCTGVDCDPTDMAPSRENYPDYGHNAVNFKIDKMIVKGWKESWLAGSSEICIRAALSCHNDRAEGAPYPAETEHYLSDQKSSYLGKLIAKFKRKEVKNQTEKILNYSLETNWQNQLYQSDPIFFDYLIFERDIWPARLQKQFGHYGRSDKIYPFNEDADNWDQWYRSSGAPGSELGWHYSAGTFVNTTAFPNTPASMYYNSGLVDNASIKFNTIGY